MDCMCIVEYRDVLEKCGYSWARVCTPVTGVASESYVLIEAFGKLLKTPNERLRYGSADEDLVTYLRGSPEGRLNGQWLARPE